MLSGIDIAERPGLTEVDSFIIFPPSGVFRGERALRGIEAFLGERFPGLLFYANGDIPPFDGDYQLIPVIGVGGDSTDPIRVLDAPSETLLLAIEAALKLFRPADLVVN
jgi:hypothetical protein